MTRKFFLILACVLVGFFIELFLFNIVGRLFLPNLLILLVICFNIFLGIRYSLFTAVVAGLLKDSFSISPFGVYLFSFVAAAFITTVLKRYIYHRGSRFSLLLLTLLVLLINGLVHFLIAVMLGQVEAAQVVKFIFVPEILSTVVVANFVFYQLKTCVLKFSVL